MTGKTPTNSRPGFGQAGEAQAGDAQAGHAGHAMWWLLPVAAGMLLGLSSLAWGQDNPPSPPGTIAPPGSQAANPTSPGTSLSNSNGVIRPPSDVDPGIRSQPPVPSSALPTPVIPPPGTAGGSPTVQPK